MFTTVLIVLILSAAQPVEAKASCPQRYIIFLIDNSASMGDQATLDQLDSTGTGRRINDPQGFRLRLVRFLVQYLHYLDPTGTTYSVAAISFADTAETWVPLTSVAQWGRVDFAKIQNETGRVWTHVDQAIEQSYQVYVQAGDESGCQPETVDLVVLTDGGLENFNPALLSEGTDQRREFHFEAINQALSFSSIITPSLHLFVFGQIGRDDSELWQQISTSMYTVTEPSGTPLPVIDAYPLVLQALQLPALEQMTPVVIPGDRGEELVYRVPPYRSKLRMRLLSDTPLDLVFHGPAGQITPTLVFGSEYLFELPPYGDWRIRFELDAVDEISEGLAFYQFQHDCQQGYVDIGAMPTVLPVDDFLQIEGQVVGLNANGNIDDISVQALLTGPGDEISYSLALHSDGRVVGPVVPITQPGHYDLQLSATSHITDLVITHAQESFWADTLPAMTLHVGAEISGGRPITVTVSNPVSGGTPQLDVIDSKGVYSITVSVLTSTTDYQALGAFLQGSDLFPHDHIDRSMLKATLPAGTTIHGLSFDEQTQEYHFSKETQLLQVPLQETPQQILERYWEFPALIIILSILSIILLAVWIGSKRAQPRPVIQLVENAEMAEKWSDKDTDQLEDAIDRMTDQIWPEIEEVGSRVSSVFGKKDNKDDRTTQHFQQRVFPVIEKLALSGKETALKILFSGLVKWQGNGPETQFSPFEKIICHSGYGQLMCNHSDSFKWVLDNYQNKQSGTDLSGQREKTLNVCQAASDLLQWLAKPVPEPDGQEGEITGEFERLQEHIQALQKSLEQVENHPQVHKENIYALGMLANGAKLFVTSDHNELILGSVPFQEPSPMQCLQGKPGPDKREFIENAAECVRLWDDGEEAEYKFYKGLVTRVLTLILKLL